MSGKMKTIRSISRSPACGFYRGNHGLDYFHTLTALSVQGLLLAAVLFFGGPTTLLAKDKTSPAVISHTDAGDVASPKPYSEMLAELQSLLEKNPTNTVLLLRIGDLCHDEGAKDNAKAAELADKYLKQLVTLDPTNAMGHALYGSALTMRARDTVWPLSRLSLAKAGNKEMDAAVALATNDIRVRFTRAINNIHMPKFMDRTEMAENDFAWLWQQVESDKTGQTTEMKQETAYFYGVILKRHKKNEEAAKVWKAGIEFAPESESARKMKKELDRIK